MRYVRVEVIVEVSEDYMPDDSGALTFEMANCVMCSDNVYMIDHSHILEEKDPKKAYDLKHTIFDEHGGI